MSLNGGTWAEASGVPLPTVAGAGWLFSTRLSTGQVTPNDCGLVLGCSTQVATRVYGHLLDQVDAHAQQEQKKIVLNGQCEANGIYPRSFRRKDKKLAFLRGWGALR